MPNKYKQESKVNKEALILTLELHTLFLFWENFP